MEHTSSDYYFASKERYNDFLKLKVSDNSIVFAVYCAGLAIECLLRAFVTRHSNQFDSRHDLLKLFIESKISEKLSQKDKDQITIALQITGRYWTNAIRYESVKSIKRKLGHEMANKKIKSHEKFLKNYYSDFFYQTNEIFKIGEKIWTH